jgi:GT2 family glycosyltransferase
MDSIGVVVIGRNEGVRLKTCINSIVRNLRTSERIIYVDSGSTDDSVDFCHSLGIKVVLLDASVNFTAALARNQGFAELCNTFPECKYVQFIDGDCKLERGWLNRAYEFLTSNHDYAVVCGRRSESNLSGSIYNRLCDIEWDTPVGNALACGGDAMMGVQAFSSVNGFNSLMVAGEEPELCYRLRESGWLIRRVNEKMTAHDANIRTFKQWSRRAIRSGHAYAWGAFLHGFKPKYYNLRKILSVIFWGSLLPSSIILSIWIGSWLLLVPLCLYSLLFFRILSCHSSKLGGVPAYMYALSIIVTKFYECYGVAQFIGRCILKKTHTLVEYK